MNTFVIANIKSSRPLQVKKAGQSSDEDIAFTKGATLRLDHGSTECTYTLAREERLAKTFEEALKKAENLTVKLENFSPEFLASIAEEDRHLYRPDSHLAVKPPKVVILALNIEGGQISGQAQAICQVNTREGQIWESRFVKPNQLIDAERLVQDIQILAEQQRVSPVEPVSAPVGGIGFFGRLSRFIWSEPAAQSSQPPRL